jgi:hypothetical protein
MILNCRIERAHLKVAAVGKGILPFQQSGHLKPNGKHQKTACMYAVCQSKEDLLDLARLRACNDVFLQILVFVGNHRRDGSIVGLQKATSSNGNCSNLRSVNATCSLSVAENDEVVEKVLCAILRLCYDIFCENKSLCYGRTDCQQKDDEDDDDTIDLEDDAAVGAVPPPATTRRTLKQGS